MRPQNLEEEYGFTAWPSAGNLMLWNGILSGEEGTIWEDAKLQLDIKIPNDYPSHGPDVVVKNPNVFHPNIQDNGHVCVDLLYDWTPDSNIITALLAVQGLLNAPAPSNGYDNEARRLSSDKSKYDQRLRAFVEATKADYKRVYGEDNDDDYD
jgi:ubiquitin-protein ligase